MNPDIEDGEEPPMLVDVATLPPQPDSLEKEEQPKSPDESVVNRVPITLVTGNHGQRCL